MKKIYWLALLPPIAILLMVGFVNRVEPYVLGFPFLLFWLTFWAVATSVIMFTIYHLDPINKEDGA